MVNKALLYGIGGFILGGLVVALAATTFDKQDTALQSNATAHSSMSMEQMTTTLTPHKGDAYDKAFISEMMAHHQAAVDMANLSNRRAKHTEVKTLSQAIITAQQKEIKEMKQWQMDWGYGSSSSTDMNDTDHMSH